MLSVKLTSDGDIDFSKGYLQWVEGIESVIQHVRSRLNFAKNTFYVFPNEGLPYLQNVLSQKDVKLAVETIKNTILKTPDVNELLSLDYDFNSRTRTLSINYKINTIYGSGNDTINIEI